MNSHRKPLLVHSVHGRRDVPPLERLRDGGVPVTDSIPVLAAVASALQKSGDWSTADQARPDFI